MTVILGLTGSIGMGKSTTAELFAEAGCPVWDADAAVHRLYAAGGAAVAPMKVAFPDAIEDGAVSRERLKAEIAADPAAFVKIETIVHPLVAADRAQFIADATADVVVLDVPLLFETGGNTLVDAIVCVTVPAEVQKARVMARGKMSEAHFEAIKAKQTPDEVKQRRSDYVIVTDTIEHAREQVQQVLEDVRRRHLDA